MEIYKGIATFSGIAIGKILYYSRGEYQIRQCLVSNIKKEIADFQKMIPELFQCVSISHPLSVIKTVFSH